MRRLPAFLFTIVAVAFLASPVSAQTTTGITWGVQGGIGIGYGTISENASRDIEPTFNAGLFANKPLGERFSFQVEAKYDRRTITISEIPTEVTYISVPLLLKNNFRGIYMVQGVAVNFLASASIFDVDFKDAYTSPDFAIIVGAGKRFNRVSVEGRWETGLRTFQDSVEFNGVRLRTLTGVVSYHF